MNPRKKLAFAVGHAKHTSKHVWRGLPRFVGNKRHEGRAHTVTDGKRVGHVVVGVINSDRRISSRFKLRRAHRSQWFSTLRPLVAGVVIVFVARQPFYSSRLQNTDPRQRHSTRIRRIEFWTSRNNLDFHKRPAKKNQKKKKKIKPSRRQFPHTVRGWPVWRHRPYSLCTHTHTRARARIHTHTHTHMTNKLAVAASCAYCWNFGCNMAVLKRQIL